MIVQLTILYLLVPLIYPSPLHSPRQPFAKESNEQPKKETRIPSDVDQFNNFGLTMNHKEHEDPIHLNTKTIKEVSFVAQTTEVEAELNDVNEMKNDVINTSKKTSPTQKHLEETSSPEKHNESEENNLVDDDDLHVESTTTVSARIEVDPKLNQQLIEDLVAPTIILPVSKSTTEKPNTDAENENYLNVLEPAHNDDLENIVATMEPTLRELEGKHEADDVVTSPLIPVVLTPTDELTSSTLVPLIDSIRQNVYFDEDPQSVPDDAFNGVKEDLSDSDVEDEKEDELQRLEDVKTTIKLPQVVNISRQYPMAHQSKGDSYTDLIPKLPIVPTETPRTEISSVAECFVSILARFVSSIEVDLQKEEEETFWQSVVAGIQMSRTHRTHVYC